jgi:hypothetical protein
VSLETGKQTVTTVVEGKEVVEEKSLKLSEARTVALEARILRWRLNILYAHKRAYDEYTVEGQSETARFNFLCSTCMFDDEGNRLFKSIDDYYEHSEKEHIIEAASRLANLVFGTEEWQRGLQENKFLLKHKLVDETGRLINKAGKYIDIEGKELSDDKLSEHVEAVFEDDL